MPYLLTESMSVTACLLDGCSGPEPVLDAQGMSSARSQAPELPCPTPTPVSATVW